MKVFFLSLGCDKNTSDSEHMMRFLLDGGYEFTDDEREADVAVVNSCCFIGDAAEESIQEIIRLGKLKTEGRLKALVVAGCLSERYQDEFLHELPEVDGILGISSWDHINKVVQNALMGKRTAVFAEKARLVRSTGRVMSSGGHYAYLKIAEGCSRRCAYCVIPKVRGPYRSVPMEDLVQEASELSANGVRELILVAQETTLYGIDLYERKALPELLERLSDLNGIDWIRLLYCYPEEITDELIEAIRTLPKVVPYIDMPIQHASDRILKMMGRRTTRAEITERIRKIREQIPGMTLRTTMLVGFPGEQEDDFNALLDFVKEIRFDRLGAFAYSQEEGTEAALMPDQVPEELKRSRVKKLMRLQKRISRSLSEEKVGKELSAMVEGRLTGEEETYAARTEGDAPDVDGYIFIHSDRELLSGDIVRVRVTHAEDYDLLGELIS
ncbi:MAG: 30S ribosomal protein S12 methylthiotransferase RimO [Lachnospiraceae bacterium]|nr:30S ribosomal protein S12 methylthiotransferase RimO [Lachnospiraceae bacterium]